MANSDISIKITNLPQIRSAFNRAPFSMTRELNTAIKKTLLNIQGKEVLQYQTLGIRVITGGLIQSIRRGYYQSNLRGEVGPNVTGSPGVEYAVYVHSGTKFMRARPFLLNAVEDTKESTQKFFTDAVNNVLSEIGRLV